jgi:hypothetical protein
LNRFAVALVAVAIIAAIALVVNPEPRAFLLFADSLGWDLVVVLFAAQVQIFAHRLGPLVSAFVAAVCRLTIYIGSCAVRAYPQGLRLLPFDKVVVPALVLITFGMRCGLRRS